ncbi:queuosine precursor transporter [Patescibacteria group bacterium]|nr:queuosine precursor transporter [Patescibacteria group bacterium]MBU1075365.1 queuosine precursor transporter [Patescibacteria group bacterium]MBU1951891.1 queuosine precursor transporter [Patescibacteria group bacterium]
MKIKQENKISILLGVFIAALISANLLGSKITEIFGVRTSVGIFALPIAFLVTDIVAEVYGKKKAQSFIITAFVANILVLLLTILAVKMPAHSIYEYGEAYNAIFSNSVRIILASMAAFLISQFHDIWAFDFWKSKTKNKFLWLRNNLSTIVSQFIDTTIFMFIAFYHVSPKFTVAFIFSLVFPYWILKVVFAMLDTPFVYLGVRWVKNNKSDIDAKQ